MKVVAIIQARMGSTRLPGKMMMNILGIPVLAHVFNRVKKAKTLSEIVLATTTDASDDVLVEYAQNNNIPVFRGSVSDVCARYYEAAKQYSADVVVRITGDCPLIDPIVIDEVVGEYLKGGYDYVCNTQPPTFPDGLDTEVFSFAALEKASKEATLTSEREHVTPYIWKNPLIFKIKNVTHTSDLSAERLTLDTPEDYIFLTKVIEAVGVDAPMNTVLSEISNHPEWQKIIAGATRNEGYAKSLDED